MSGSLKRKRLAAEKSRLLKDLATPTARIHDRPVLIIDQISSFLVLSHSVWPGCESGVTRKEYATYHHGYQR